MSSERQIDNTENPWWGEHIHRYQEAIRILGNTGRVMDIACGTGFGSYLLAKHGFKVVGGDISRDAIEHCKEKYQLPELQFELIDGTNIHFPTASFDAVISFETIEHTIHFHQMLYEFKRICKKDATIILSTPNFLINSPNGVIINKFHTQEWTYVEFYNILSQHFSTFKIFGQQYSRYKNKKSFKYFLAKKIENILYSKGFRKLSISIQDKIMKKIIGLPLYPNSNDYDFTESINEIKKCKTFLAICRP